ncbi:MAG: hypothetical protein ACXAD7_15575 [Candidatus Kariarchaeaceae archaeon]|jgi:DNA-binding transcriptional ArsR family regulator
MLDLKTRTDFTSYWNQLPVLKIIKIKDETQYKKVFHKHRKMILDVLTKGRDESQHFDGQPVKRNVLSANEIKIELKNQFNFNISKPSLYHHLQKLEGFEIIKVVKSISSDMSVKNVAYYGKTSKVIFLAKPKTRNVKFKIFEDKSFLDLMNRIGTYNTDIMKRIATKLDDNQEDIEHFKGWYEENEDLLHGNYENILDLVDFFGFISKFDEEVINWIVEIRRQLKIT